MTVQSHWDKKTHIKNKDRQTHEDTQESSEYNMMVFEDRRNTGFLMRSSIDIYVANWKHGMHPDFITQKDTFPTGQTQKLKHEVMRSPRRQV